MNAGIGGHKDEDDKDNNNDNDNKISVEHEQIITSKEEIIVGQQLEEENKHNKEKDKRLRKRTSTTTATIIPPSVSKPVKRKRVDVGGKLYEDESVVLNVRLKQYGYESIITLLRDFKDGIFPERYFKPQGALHMAENQSTNGAVSLIDVNLTLISLTTSTMKRCMSFIEMSCSYLALCTKLL